jgi:hypothetical protein
VRGLDRDVAAEGKAAEQVRQAGEFLAAAPVRGDGERIVDLAAAFVPDALRGADAAEVEANAGPAEVEAGARDRLHDLVVERAAELRVRVAGDRQAARGRGGRSIAHSIRPAGPAICSRTVLGVIAER